MPRQLDGINIKPTFTVSFSSFSVSGRWNAMQVGRLQNMDRFVSNRV